MAEIQSKTETRMMMKKTRAELKAEKVEELMKMMDGVSDENLEKWHVSLGEPIRVPTTWTTTLCAQAYFDNRIQNPRRFFDW